jgi:glycosyltransferase involved in cell wall biosynthesis
MISVCMATYNGERWIEAQLRSILPQLGSTDEVVLIDDASRDATLAKVNALGDSRIRVLRNEKNLGVDASFERALQQARGDVIFLSDQDDLWCRDKVARVMEIFSNEAGVTLVQSDARLIDAEGLEIGSSYYAQRGGFTHGVLSNIVRCKFLGCAMAFRRTVRDQCLPFPKRIPGHDMWIGLVNEYYGRTYFISEPLIAYRRHGRNVSPDRHQSLRLMLKWRYQLLMGLASNICSHSRTPA